MLQVDRYTFRPGLAATTSLSQHLGLDAPRHGRLLGGQLSAL